MNDRDPVRSAYSSPNAAESRAWDASDVGPQSPRGEASFRATATGLRLLYYGLLLAFFGALFALVAVVLRNQLDDRTGLVLPFLAINLFGAAVLVSLVGIALCFAAPSETGAQSPLVCSVIFQLLNIVAGIVVYAFEGQFRADTSLMIHIGANVLGVVGFVYFLVFLKRLASFVENWRMVRRAEVLSQAYVATSVAAVIALGLLIWVESKTPGFVALGIVGVVFLAILAGYADLLDNLRADLVWSDTKSEKGTDEKSRS